MGEVLCSGFNLAVSSPSDRRGSEARIVLLLLRIKRRGLFILIGVSLSTSCHLAQSFNYSVCHKINTIDACWIAVDW